MHIETEKTRNTGVKRVVYKLLLNLIRIVQILFAKPVNRYIRVQTRSTIVQCLLTSTLSSWHPQVHATLASRPSLFPCLHAVLMLLRSSGLKHLASCALVLRHIVRSMTLSRHLVVTWIIASVLYPAPLCATCARTQVTFGPATPAPAPVDRPMDTG